MLLAGRRRSDGRAGDPVRNLYIFTTHIYEDGDFALNSMLVNHTHHSVQLVGNYSRVGFDHPGPVYIYVLSVGQTLFHDVAALSCPASTTARSWPTSLPAIGVDRPDGDVDLPGDPIASRARRGRLRSSSRLPRPHQMVGYVWMPNMYMTAFALLHRRGDRRSAAGTPASCRCSCVARRLLVHGHVAFIIFVAVTIAGRQSRLGAVAIGVSGAPSYGARAVRCGWPAYWSRCSPRR